MGWRKLTIQDGDLARCCAAEGPIIREASLEAEESGHFKVGNPACQISVRDERR